MSGNGTDQGHIIAMLMQLIDGQSNQAHQTAELWREVRELKSDVGGLKADMSGIKADVNGLRSAVTAYHSSVLGHGILISEMDGRLRRLEDHVGLPPLHAAV